ncbi:MAG: hypothetical protein ACXVLQ_05345 [Bacteriovorax sp.]
MNGTIFDEIKKKGESKKKEKLKFLFAIISTNLFVAILCLNLNSQESPAVNKVVRSPIFHPRFKMVVAPLSVMADISSDSLETPVTLMDKNKKIIIAKAYLHEEIKGPEKGLGAAPRFKIEIPEDEVIKIGSDEGDLMIAIPELKLPAQGKKPSNKRVSKYEVSL